MLRSPAFAIPFLLLPVAVYLFFGVVLAGPAVAKQAVGGQLSVLGILVFAVMGPALFGVGCALAIERECRLAEAEARACPPRRRPPHREDGDGDGLRARSAMASVMVAGRLVGTGHASRRPQLAIMTLVMVVGAVPFAALGLFIGAHTSGSAAPAFVNLDLPADALALGTVHPAAEVPRAVRVIWPAFHLNQVALGAAGVSEFRFIAPAICAAVLLGVTVLFGGLAIRRLARKG